MSAKLQKDRDALLAVVKKLLDWGRDHTSPLDENSPHALLVEAHGVVNRAEAPEQETVSERYRRWHREG